MWNTGNKTYDLNIDLIPFPTAPSNADCSGATCGTAPTTGCNYGSTPETSWNQPTDWGTTCSGNNWYTADNPVYYCLTATTANPSIEITNIVCNNGTSGTAQFAAYTNCSSLNVNTTTSTDFKGCAAGSGTVTLTTSNIAANSTFILVVDGNAGDVCKWNFNYLGVLPVQMVDFYVKSASNNNVVFWNTTQEINNAFFIVERSADGVHFEEIGRVEGNGTSNEFNSYKLVDNKPITLAYYRIVQVDINGKMTTSQLYKVERTMTVPVIITSVYPNPIGNESLSYTIKLKERSNIQSTLIDMTGKLMIEKTIAAEAGLVNFEMDTHSLASGIYFLQVTDLNTGFHTQQKLVKN